MKNLTKKTFIAFISIFGLSLLLLALPEQTQANGGTIIFPQNNQTGDVGPFNVLVTETPSPPGPDTPVHLSVLLTRAKSDLRVMDASLLFSPLMSGMAMPDAPTRRSFPGQQPNTYDVDLPLSMEGDWTVNITIHSPTLGDATFPLNLKIEKPSPPWPFIIGILVGLPILAALTWWLLFRGNNTDDDEDEDEAKVVTKSKAKTEQSGTKI